MTRLGYLLAYAVVAVGLYTALAFRAPELPYGGLVPKNPPAPERIRPGAYEALGLFGAARAYPFADVVGAGYQQAVRQRQTMEALRRSGAADPPWVAIGPHNIAGRMLAIELNPQNPNTLWAGSASGGVWRSYSAGLGAAAWERVPTGFGALAVSTIALAPGDSNTIYLGTGEVYRYRESLGGIVERPTRGSYGIGILKSSDGGRTWTQSLDWSRTQERGVWRIRFAPGSPQTLWAATTEGVYVSRDAGASWTQTMNIVMCNDVVIKKDDPNTLVAGCGNQRSPGHGLYRTTDGGQTWNKVTAGVPSTFIGKIQLDQHPTNPAILYASVGDGIENNTRTFLLRSTDGGATWSTLSTANYASYQGWFAHYVGVSPLNPNLVMAGGVEMWRSTNGGITLLQRTRYAGLPEYPPIDGPDGPPDYLHPDHHAIAFHPTNANLLYFAHDGGISRSTDGGQTYESINGGLQTAQFYPGTSHAPDDSTFALGGLQDNGAIRFLGDLRWQRPTGGDGSWTGIDPVNPTTIFTSYQYLNLFRSTDGGFFWEYIGGPPNTDDEAFIAPFLVLPTVMVAARSTVWRSFDRGDSWVATNGGAPLDGQPVLTLAAAPGNDDVLWATTAPLYPVSEGGRPGVFVTRNGGTTWTNVTAGLPDRFLMDVAVDPTDDRTAYVAVGGFGTSHLFRTTDSGLTWTDVGAGLPDVPTAAVFIDPLAPAHVYVGNDVGVFVSRDRGQTWAAYSDGLPEGVIVYDLALSPSNRALRVATHGNGMYERRLPRNPSASEETPVALRVALAPPFPNPARDATTLTFTLAQPADARLTLYDLQGRRLAVPAAARYAAGTHRVRVATDGLAAGTYLAELRADGQRLTHRLTVIR